MGYVFRLKNGYFGEEEGGHSRAARHWGAMLEGWLENAVNQGWHGHARVHGVAVLSCCLQMLVFCTVLWFVLFVLFFCWGVVFGLKTWSNGNLGSDTN